MAGVTVRGMEFTALAARVWAVRCTGHAGWSDEDARDDFRLVLVRRGRFRRRVAGTVTDLDTSVAYLGAPGEVESFAHPAGGDVCTSVTLPPELGEPRPALYVDARVDLAHRRMLANIDDPDFGLVEALLNVLGHVPPARPADRLLVQRAREAIAADEAGGLLSLAAALGVSPYRLSRAFTRELGVSLTRYRNRVRVGRVLDRLERGEQGLAALAAGLGFADQAHLCRTVRAHVGHTPTELRRLTAWTASRSAAGDTGGAPR